MNPNSSKKARESSKKTKCCKKGKHVHTTSRKKKKFSHLEISKINQQIYLGSYEHACENTDEFRKLNIDVIFNCAKEIKYEVDEGYIIENIEMENEKYSSMLEVMDHANDLVKTYLAQGKKIYFHCDTGISRSPAIIIYYLMTNKNFKYFDALSLIEGIRPIVEINEEFQRELRTIEED